MALHSASAHEVSSAKVKKPTTISCLKSAHRWNYESQNENVTNIWQNHNANCKCHCKLACYENYVLRVIFYFYMYSKRFFFFILWISFPRKNTFPEIEGQFCKLIYIPNRNICLHKITVLWGKLFFLDCYGVSDRIWYWESYQKGMWSLLFKLSLKYYI